MLAVTGILFSLSYSVTILFSLSYSVTILLGTLMAKGKQLAAKVNVILKHKGKSLSANDPCVIVNELPERTLRHPFS